MKRVFETAEYEAVRNSIFCRCSQDTMGCTLVTYVKLFDNISRVFQVLVLALNCVIGVAVVGGLVYAVGGFNGSLRVRTVDVYDPVKDSWSSVASMEARRSTLGAAVLNGSIYAIGGFDGSSGRYISCSRSF